MAKDTVEVLLEGGTATPGPPLGPAIGPFGVNMMQVVEEINKKSADFAGMKVPVIITIYGPCSPKLGLPMSFFPLTSS